VGQKKRFQPYTVESAQPIPNWREKPYKTKREKTRGGGTIDERRVKRELDWKHSQTRAHERFYGV